MMSDQRVKQAVCVCAHVCGERPKVVDGDDAIKLLCRRIKKVGFAG
jgi:hypothetical protein